MKPKIKVAIYCRFGSESQLISNGSNVRLRQKIKAMQLRSKQIKIA